ncbi:M23 family metallopeptidase [Luteimonas sp. WGS1318]|uniref:M23 family metallopeptidase n=1 Tax=Luteimonas sp. WGS1318 TaxID=3366815 RepID=UPI00372D20F1
MRRTGLWFALVAVLLLVNVVVFVWRSPTTPVTSQSAAVASGPTEAMAAVTPPDTDAGPAPDLRTTPPAASMPAQAIDAGAAASDPNAHPARLLLPVQGIDVADVHDTFDDARGDERRHEALDVMAPEGTPVLAAADGRIEKLFTSDRGGLTIYQFDPTGTWSYYYAHLQAYAPGLTEGMQVRRGDVLGTVGSTGNADPSAPHLHFAVFRLTPEKQWWTGAPVNPWPLLARDP